MKRSLICALAIALLSACSTKEIDIQTPVQDDVVFYASFEQPAEVGTRVYANEDLLLRWTADDRVSIFNKITFNQQYKFTGETGDNAGGFQRVDSDEFVTGNTLLHVVSVYPYQDATKITEDELLTVTLPAEQSYGQNTFGLGANTMVSVSSNNVLQYKNVGGYLRVSLYGEGVSVSSITLKGNGGEKIAGKASVSMPLDGVPTVEMASDATSEITLKCTVPVQLGATADESTHFWIVVPPVTFSEGFSIVVRDDNNGVFEKVTSKRLDISRNTVSKMAALKAEIQSQEINEPLTIEAIEEGVVSFNNPIGLTIEYSKNGEVWTSTEASISIDLKAGERILFRGNNESYSVNFPGSSYMASKIDCSSPCYVYGNFMSLVNSEGFGILKELLGLAVFSDLFSGNVNIYNHPEKNILLPATKLSSYCYSGMFRGCTGLTRAPRLPSMIMAEGCYGSMFEGCSSLQEPPELNSHELASGCYQQMFSRCSSLTTAPELPATKMATSCYMSMFYVCTSLKAAPELPATELASSCYQSMFAYCSSLESGPSLLPATTLAMYCYKNMFRGCSIIQSAPVLPAEVLSSNCYEGMFNGCSSLNYIKAMFISAPGRPTKGWVDGVAENGVFIMNAMATWDDRGVDAIPVGWQVYREESVSDINVVTYMNHSAGIKSVPLVILPDGFVKEDLPTFRSRAIECIETLFSVEPYKSYRDYFSVYIIEVPSDESGASITDGAGNIITKVNSYFETRWGADSYGDMRANDVKLRQIASICPDITNGDHTIAEVPIALIVNDSRYGGICISDSFGNAYCIIPYSYSGETISWSYPASEAASNVDDSQGYRTVPSSELSEMGICYGNWKNIFVHEFGGHAFGRLADEYWYSSNSAFSQVVTGHSFSIPFGLNISGSYYEVPWQELLDNQLELVSRDPHYSRMGIYQGGDVCMFGRWRNERISCMIDNRLYFSAWQRYLITKRIMTLSGCIDEFSFDSWVTKDNTADPVRDNRSSNTISSSVSGVVHQEELLLPPVLIEK